MNKAKTSFDDFITALTGYEPLRWQQRLFRRFTDHDIPTVCSLPTGLGKASVIPIWLIALADLVQRPHGETSAAGILPTGRVCNAGLGPIAGRWCVVENAVPIFLTCGGGLTHTER